MFSGDYNRNLPTTFFVSATEHVRDFTSWSGKTKSTVKQWIGLNEPKSRFLNAEERRSHRAVKSPCKSPEFNPDCNMDYQTIQNPEGAHRTSRTDKTPYGTVRQRTAP